MTSCTFWKDLRAAGCKQTKATRMRAEVEADQGAVLVTEVGRVYKDVGCDQGLGMPQGLPKGGVRTGGETWVCSPGSSPGFGDGMGSRRGEETVD